MTRDDATPGARDRKARPRLEGLEGRLLLYSTTGGAWTQPERVTFSFAPDGTDIGGTPSALFSTLNAKFATSAWEGAFLKAAAVWESVANVNLVQVSDNGAAIGSTGDQQGDPNFGDIRIGGMSQGSGSLAFAFLPPPMNGGTAAGDIFFNTDQSWQINNDYDLETVAIHEFGHALGMAHSAITSADMYAFYNGVNQYTSPDDVAGIQSIYGARPADGTNTTLANASDITSRINSSGQITIPGLTINNNYDSDWYKVTVPTSTTGTMVVTMQSTNLSELSPRIQLFNGSNKSLGYQTAVGAFGATVSVSLSNVTAGQVYYIRAAAANGGITGTGAYGLLLNFGSSSQAPIAPPNTTVASQPDQGGGSIGDSTGATIGSQRDGGRGGLLGGGGSGQGSDGVFGLANNLIQWGTLSGAGDTLSVAQSTDFGGSAWQSPNSSGDATLLVAPGGTTLTHDAALAALDTGGGSGAAANGNAGGSARSWRSGTIFGA